MSTCTTDLQNLETFLIGAGIPYSREVVPHVQTIPTVGETGDDPSGLSFTTFLRTTTVVRAGIFDAWFGDDGRLKSFGRPGAVT